MAYLCGSFAAAAEAEKLIELSAHVHVFAGLFMMQPGLAILPAEAIQNLRYFRCNSVIDF